MDPPRSLPARLYLLAYDPAKERLRARGRMGYALRAAALTDLQLHGHLRDADGCPQVNVRAPLPTDPVLGAVLDEVAESRPRPWAHWVARHTIATKAAITEQLVAGGWIELRQHRVLGVLRTARITVPDLSVVSRLGDRVRETLRAATPDPADTALVALAAAGELSAVLPAALRSQHEHRVAELIASAGPAVPALTAVLVQDHVSGRPAAL